MQHLRRTAFILLLALVASACQVHIVGDSTAALVQGFANSQGVTMSGSTLANCGYGQFNGNRVTPDGYASGQPGYPSCVLPWTAQSPDEPDDDIVVAFVSIHDAMCSTVDGCLPVDTAAYATAHADLLAYGRPVVWVEVPPIANTALQARIDDLNAAVAVELGCSLVPGAIRVAPTYDGLHYLPLGAALVGARLSLLDAGDACP